MASYEMQIQEVILLQLTIGLTVLVLDMSVHLVLNLPGMALKPINLAQTSLWPGAKSWERNPICV